MAAATVNVVGDALIQDGRRQARYGVARSFVIGLPEPKAARMHAP